MSLSRIISLGVLLCFVPGASAAAGKPVALVYSLAGEATLTTASEGRRALRLFDRLPAGTTVETETGSRLALAFANGHRYELGEHSRVTLGRTGLSSRSGPVRSLLAVTPLPYLLPIAKEEQPGLCAGAVIIRAESIAGLYPCCGAATLAAATVLSFEPVEGGGRYRVEVQDRQGNVVFTEETTTAAVTAAEVKLPAGRLKPGLRYHWTVRTIERVGPVARGDADFVVLSADLAKAREKLRVSVEAAGDSALLALLAEVDRDLGLLAEARDELRAAVHSAPEDAALAEALARLERLQLAGNWK